MLTRVRLLLLALTLLVPRVAVAACPWIGVAPRTAAPTNGEDFADCLNTNNHGDTITLDHTKTYARTDTVNGVFGMHVPGAGTGPTDYVTITTDDVAGISASGTRINPYLHRTHMPTIQGSAKFPFQSYPGANYYKFIGIIFTSGGNTSYNSPDVIALGGNSEGGNPTLGQTLAATNFTIDRCIVKPAELDLSLVDATGEITFTSASRDYTTGNRGIHIAVQNATITESWIGGFAGGYYPGGAGYLNEITNVAVAPSPAASGVSIGVTPGTGTYFNPIGSEGNVFLALLYPGASDPNYGNSEFVLVTAQSGDTVTVTRAYTNAGTVPLSHGPRTVLVGDRLAKIHTTDSYGIYADSAPVNGTRLTNSFIQGGVNPFFLGGGSLPATSTTIASGASSTGAVLTSVSGLVVGMPVSICIPAFDSGTPLGCTHGDRRPWKNGRITSIVGNTVVWSGTEWSIGNITTETPLTPGEVQWSAGHHITDFRVTNSTIRKYSQFQGLKGFYEIKEGLDVVITGNKFIGDAPSSPDPAITVHNQNFYNPWTQVCRFTFENNYVFGMSRVANALTDSESASENSCDSFQRAAQPTAIDVIYRNNLLIGAASDPHTETFYWMAGQKTLVDHNTIIDTGASHMFFGVTPSTNVTYKNNIVSHSGSTNYATCTAPGGAFTDCWPAISETKNVIVDNSTDNPAVGFPASYVIGSIAGIGFTNYAGGDYSLTGASAYHNAATDATDIGVNCATLPVGSCSGGSVPGAITDLSASAGNAQITLSWTSISGATSYKIKRGLTAGTETLLTTVSAGPYTDYTVSNGTAYFYVVVAANSIGDSANSNEVSATPSAGGGGGPTPVKLPLPIGLVACASQTNPPASLVAPSITLKVCHDGQGVSGWAGLLDTKRVPVTLARDGTIFSDGLTQFTGTLSVTAGVHTLQLLPIYGPAGDGPPTLPFSLTVRPLKTAPVNLRVQ